MQVTIVGHLNLNVDEVMRKHGLDDGGRAQKWLDSEVIRLTKPYMPFLNGGLMDSATRDTVIGSGLITQNTPYARYQYYGKLMVDPVTLKGSFYDQRTGRHWSRPGVSKIMDPEGRNLVYNQSKNPKAGKMWFERMKMDHTEDLLEGLKKVTK